MNPERWKKVKTLLMAVLEQSPENQATFLRQECQGDEALVAEIQSLLRQEPRMAEFLINPPGRLEVDATRPSEGGFEVPSDRILGDYRVLEKLGEGGFGNVYRARQVTLDREAVVKVLRRRHQADSKLIERFRREAHLASRLEHPYTSHIYDFGVEPDGLMWIAMEFVRGTPLNRFLKLNGPLAVERFVPFFDKICEVVHTAHEFGIVHRDLKPANIMVLNRAGRMLPKLLDFGIARELVPQGKGKDVLGIALDNAMDTNGGNTYPLAANPTSETTQIIGSPAYMSPEQWHNGVLTDFRTDIYALGVLAFECLTGKVPFEGNSIAQLLRAHAEKPVPPLGPEFPLELSQIITIAMAKQPGERFGSALEFAHKLRLAAGLKSDSARVPQLNEFLRDSWLLHAPQPVAAVVSSLGNAMNPYQAKEQLGELIRVVVRYLGIMALSSRRRTGRSERPDLEETTALILQLHRTQLSDLEWLALIRDLCRPFAKNPDVYPIPELVGLFFEPATRSPLRETDFLDSIRKIVELRQAVGREGQVRDTASRLMELTTLVLNRLSFLFDYKLVVVRRGSVERRMGVTAIREGIDLTLHCDIPIGQSALLNRDNVPVAVLHPFVQVQEPVPGLGEEMFFLEGKGRVGAKFLSFPNGFEHQEEGFWDWFSTHVWNLEARDSDTVESESIPYPGLRSFGSADSRFFFGRELEIERVLNSLKLHPLMAVVGPSGAGKSSFVQAGILAELAATHSMVTVRPGNAPMANLKARFSKSGIFLDATAEVDTEAVGQSLVRWCEQTGRKAILVVDQFEELLTLCTDPAEQRHYAESLANAARSPEDPVRVMVTLRDDFLFRAKALPVFGTHFKPELLTIPETGEMVRILTLPARKLGYEFEDVHLPQEMAQSVEGRSGALSLLAFTVSKLWEFRDRQFKLLRRNAYESMGGVGGALAGHAEQVHKEMTDQERLLIREAFRRLVTSEGTRTQISRADLLQVLANRPEANRVIEQLVASRLLIASEGIGGTEQIEIIHETLVTAWPRLVEWRREDREGTRLWEQLQAAAQQWDSRGRPNGLLWRDEALDEYRLWRSRYPGNLTVVQQEFGKRSLAEANRSKRRRQTVLAGIIFGLLIGSGILFWQRQQARQQLLETLQLYEEQGRQEMMKGNPEGAAVYLSEAYEKGADTKPLRFMLAQAMSSLEGQAEITLGSHQGGIQYGEYRRDGTLIVTVGNDHTAKVWETSTNRLKVTLAGFSENPVEAHFNPDGSRIVTAGGDGEARIWDATTGTLLLKLDGHPAALSTAIFSPDGSLVATASLDGTARLWNAASGRPMRVLGGHQGALYSVAFSPDGRQIVTTSADRTAKLWDTTSGQLQTTLTGHQGAVLKAVFSPDGTYLATAGADRIGRLWESGTGKAVSILIGHSSGLSSLVFSPDGNLLATAGTDGTARLWSVPQGAVQGILNGHAGNVFSVGFNSTGDLVVTSSVDGSARVWERSTGKLLMVLKDQTGPLAGACFSPLANLILTYGEDQTAKIWNVHPETRSSAEIAAIVQEKVHTQLTQGRLGPTVNVPETVPPSNPGVVLHHLAKPGWGDYQFETLTVDRSGNVIERHSLTTRAWGEDLGDGILLEMTYIPGGSFIMGSPVTEPMRNTGEQEHRVTLRPFLIGRFEITQRQWRQVAALPPVNRLLSASLSRFKGDDLPVDSASWLEAVEFCDRLSRLTGRAYRLPSESEWEYACRAGTTTPFAFGETLTPELASYDYRTSYQTAPKSRFVETTRPVGAFGVANAFGLYDCHGNVFEWCLDLIHRGYAGAPVDGSPFYDRNFEHRVCRGGAWDLLVPLARSAFEDARGEDAHTSENGLRVVMELPTAPPSVQK